MKAPEAGEDRWLAAACYALPLVGPLYVLATARSKPHLWRHAIQSLALYGAIAVIVNVLKVVPPVAGMSLAEVAIGAGMLLFAAFAWLAYGGHALRLPWIADFADRWRGPSVALLDIGVHQWNFRDELAMHRRALSDGGPASAGDVLPKITGKHGPLGFEIEFVGDLGGIAMSFLGRRSESWFTRGELVVATWPVRLGEETALRYRAIPKGNARVERISARLKCIEVKRYRDKDNDLRTSSLVLHTMALADAAAPSAAWTCRLPREGPPSLAASGGGLCWLLEVDVRLASGGSSTQNFDLLVTPRMAAP